MKSFTRKSSPFTLKLEGSAGSSIEDCFDDALRIAQMLGLFVEFDFNEVTCIVRQSDTYSDRDLFVENYHLQQKKTGGYKICVV